MTGLFDCGDLFVAGYVEPCRRFDPVPRQISQVLIPPVAAQRHEQADDIAEASALGLHPGDRRQKPGLLCVEHRQHIDRAAFLHEELLLHDLEVLFSALLDVCGGFHRLVIRLQGAQRVGDVLERGDDRLSIQRLGLSERDFRRLLLVDQREAVENRRVDIVVPQPKRRALRERRRDNRGEQLGEAERAIAGARG